MKLKIIMSAFVVLCVITLSGCSSRQLEDMDILTTYFADSAEDKIKLGGGVANVRTLSDSMADTPVSLIFAEGGSLSEAEERLSKSADHPLFFGGVRAVIVSENFAKKGIYEFLGGLKSDYKLRSEAMFFITKSNPEEIVMHKAINDFTGGFAAESLIRSLGAEGRITASSLSDVFEMMSVKKTGLAVAAVNIDDDIMQFEGYGIFDGEGLVGFAEGDVAEGINIFLNKNASVGIYSDKKKYTLKKIKEKKKARFEGGRLIFDIEFEFESELSGEGVKKAENMLKAQAESAFEMVRESGCDFLELYRIYQKDYRYEFETADYKKQLKNSEATINIKVKKAV